MIDLQNEFDSLPHPIEDATDAGAARRVWLRARTAAIVEDDSRLRRLQRLRMSSAMAVILTVDAIVPLLLAPTSLPFVATLSAIVLVHSLAAVTLLRA